MEGKVGVLVSYGYGAGWSTWNSEVDPCNKQLVEAFENGLPKEEILALAEELYPNTYHGGLLDCEVEYLDKGILFRINEYDGSESLETNESVDWLVAL